MLSIQNFKFPRKVYIRIAKAEKLVLSKKDNKKKDNSKFRAVILGGKKKETSPLIDDISGNPEWNFSCIVKLHRGKADPISLLVEDSEGHHKGQVVIPLIKISPRPYTITPDKNPATSSNIICSELEPTNKCSKASGYLIYWIWVEEYCTQEDGESKTSFKHSMSSMFGSMNVIGSSKSRKSDITGSHSNISSAISLNKPQSHKKALSVFHIKSKKSKVVKSSSDYNATIDSSDAESNIDPGNLFESEIKGNGSNHINRNDSFRSADYRPRNVSNHIDIIINPPTPENFCEEIDGDINDSHSTISDNGSSSKYEEEKSDHKPSVLSITPVTLTPAKIEKPTKQTKLKESNVILNNKDNLPKIQIVPDNPIVGSQFKKGHNPFNESDYSLFGESDMSENPAVTIKIDYQSTNKEIKQIVQPRKNITSIKNEINEGPTTLLSKIQPKHVVSQNLNQGPPRPENLPNSNVNFSSTLTPTKTDIFIQDISSTKENDKINVQNQPLKEDVYAINKLISSPKEQVLVIDEKTSNVVLDNPHSLIQGTTPVSIEPLKLITTDIKSTTWKEDNAILKLESSSEEYQSANEIIVPITLQPPKKSIVTLENTVIVTRDTTTASSPLSRDSTPTNIKNKQDTYLTSKSNSLNEVDGINFGHKAMNKSESSTHNSHFTSTTMKMMNDDIKILRKENSELHMQNDTYHHKVSELQSELDSVRDALYKLRTNLLLEGAIKFLERK